MCVRIQDGVNLLCRGMVLGQILEDATISGFPIRVRCTSSQRAGQSTTAETKVLDLAGATI